MQIPWMVFIRLNRFFSSFSVGVAMPSSMGVAVPSSMGVAVSKDHAHARKKATVNVTYHSTTGPNQDPPTHKTLTKTLRQAVISMTSASILLSLLIILSTAS